jgi:hypothetical protein
MLKKIFHALLAATMMLGVVAASMQPAEARHGRGVAVGVGLGLLGLGVLGAYGYSRGPGYYGYGPGPGGCYPGPRQCGWAGRHCFNDYYGNYVCRGGQYRCWRPTVCE